MRAYSQDEVTALREQADVPAESQQCPVCGERGIRRYYRMTYGRSTPAIMSCVWCPACHSYTGSTSPARGRVVDADPLADRPDAPTDQGGSKQMDRYLSFLDGLWDEGLLPQTVSRG